MIYTYVQELKKHDCKVHVDEAKVKIGSKTRKVSKFVPWALSPGQMEGSKERVSPTEQAC